MRHTTGNCTMETLDARRLFAATVELGEDAGFALQPHPNSYPSNSVELALVTASDGLGTVVRSAGPGKIAVHRDFEGEGAGSSVATTLDLPTFISAMSLNRHGDLAMTYGRATRQGFEVFARVFKVGASGAITPVTSELSLAKYRTSGEIQGTVPVGIDEAGNVTAAWTQTLNGQKDVLSKRLVRQSSGAYVLPKSAITVNTKTIGDQYDVKMAMQRTGAMTIGWEEGTTFSAQQFDALGRKVGTQVQLLANQEYTYIAPDANTGGIVAAWSIGKPEISQNNRLIQAQRFSASGAPIGTTIVVSDDTQLYDWTFQMNVAASDSGDAVVTFTRQQRLSQETISTPDGGTEVRTMTHRQAVAHHIPAGSSVGTDHVVATESWENRRITSASGTVTTTNTGAQAFASRAEAIGPDSFLVPYEIDPWGDTGSNNYWFANTLVPSPTFSATLFSDTAIDSDEAAVEELVSL